jgi:hypothetical protein
VGFLAPISVMSIHKILILTQREVWRTKKALML